MTFVVTDVTVEGVVSEFPSTTLTFLLFYIIGSHANKFFTSFSAKS